MRSLNLAIFGFIIASPVLAGWNAARDNSMSPVDDIVGRAMAVILMGSKISQGIQVCPGVYLTTAHGALNGDPNVDPKHLNIRAVAYPFIPDNLMTSTGENAEFLSPRLKGHPNYDPANADEFVSDYIFIRVDNPVRPQSFIPPLYATPEQLIRRSDQHEIDVHLYRGKTRYRTQEDGTTPVLIAKENARGKWLEVDQDGWATDLGYMMDHVYTAPYRVNQRCELSRGGVVVSSDCPTEQSVSGSPYVIYEKPENHRLVGLHVWGTNIYTKNSPQAPTGGFIPSSLFCSDYERACGQPCAQLEDVLK